MNIVNRLDPYYGWMSREQGNCMDEYQTGSTMTEEEGRGLIGKYIDIIDICGNRFTICPESITMGTWGVISIDKIPVVYIDRIVYIGDTPNPAQVEDYRI